MIGYFFVCDEVKDIRPFLYQHFPIIEPEDAQRVFVDFKGFREPFVYLQSVLTQLQDCSGPICVAMGSSKLIAKAASEVLTLGAKEKVPYRRWLKAWGIFVPPGDEKAFLQDAPIELLWPLPEKITKRLKTLGFRRIGQVMNLPLPVLEGQFGKEGDLVYRCCRGIDTYPLKRWEMPGQLRFYAQLIDHTTTNQMLAVVENLGWQVAEQVIATQRTTRNLTLRLYAGERIFQEQRQLTRGTWQRQALVAFLQGLAKDIYINNNLKAENLTGIDVVAGELQVMDFKQVELFTMHDLITTPQAEQKPKLEKVVINVQKKYHQGLQWGAQLPVSRRERFLRIWDPLRF